MINGRVFDWESVRIDAPFGLNLVITNISYSSESAVEAVHGRGRAPRGYGRGNLVQECSMDLPAPSWLILTAFAALNGGLHNIPAFPITVSYNNPDQTLQVDVLPSCVIMKAETSASQNDPEVNMKTIGINPLDPILFNGQAVL